jgi:L-ascorbate metabolism protein UlaG (beta-lactamase superfamily)
MHYNTWPPIEADPQEFKRKVSSLRKECTIMEFGSEIELKAS